MVPVRLVEASCIVRGARGTRLRDARRRVRREFGPSATPTLAIGGGRRVRPCQLRARPVGPTNGANGASRPGESVNHGSNG